MRFQPEGGRSAEVQGDHAHGQCAAGGPPPRCSRGRFPSRESERKTRCTRCSKAGHESDHDRCCSAFAGSCCSAWTRPCSRGARGGGARNERHGGHAGLPGGGTTIAPASTNAGGRQSSGRHHGGWPWWNDGLWRRANPRRAGASAGTSICSRPGTHSCVQSGSNSNGSAWTCRRRAKCPLRNHPVGLRTRRVWGACSTCP